jgi:hypothetical protein
MAFAGVARGADFERQIAPILVRHCIGCHNGSDPAGGLNLTDPNGARSGGDSQSAAIVPGDTAASHALARIRAGEMPPEGKGQPVSAEDQAALGEWIQSGASWPAQRVLSPFEFTSATRAGRDWWSLRPPRRATLPSVKQHDRVRTPIDAFVLAKLEAAGLAFSDDADRATFIRRASFDLLGLPPTRDQIEQFVSDPRPDAYERLVDRLLASPRYGERWARHWLDVVRFGESNGYETNTARPNAWPYRDWVIRALNDDVDYRDFILQQLAGDQVGVDAATGFLVGGAHDTVGSPDVELTRQQRTNDLDDIITTTGGAFLGLTVGCARCHDHKFDPVGQRDYYALQAIFAGVEHGERELRTPDFERLKREESTLREQLAAAERRAESLWMRHQPLARVGGAGESKTRPGVRAGLNVDRFAPVLARRVRFTVLATNQLEPCLDELEVFAAAEPARNVALASAGAKASASSVYASGASHLHKLEHIHDGKYGNARSWISAESGGGWVQIEWPEPLVIDRVVWARDREGAFHDRLPTAYRIEVGISGDDWQTVATSEDRQPPVSKDDAGEQLSVEGLPADVAEEFQGYRREADSLRQQIDALAPRMAYAGKFSQPEATHVLYRGEVMQPREAVAPGGIALVGHDLSLPADAPEAERRLALARWIGSPANPLTARVIVNRVWHYHFGQGLVSTPSDLGWGGGRPSHAELLDWLALEFMEQGWRLKALHRAIMLSTVYRQASAHNAQAAAIDAGNRLAWRFGARRLEAEAIRDLMLWTSGSLDLSMGGPGYEVFEPNTNYVKVYTPKQQFGPAEWRRMVYQNKPRLRDDATFGAFDCPDASQAMPRRNTSTTALQALNLLNGPFVVEQAGLFAKRLERDAPGDRDAQIRRAFWLAFGREPEQDERPAAESLVNDHGLAALCRALFNANEFLYLN